MRSVAEAASDRSSSRHRSYVERHAHLATDTLAVVAEDNAAMTGSYIMIDPMGRLFDNVDGRLVYGQPILVER
jgi:radical S-adenosyl methionine domain-containing protein 2